jgi:hypothetical protein
MLLVDFLPQKSVRSHQFIPLEHDLPEGWTAAFIPLIVNGFTSWCTGECSQTARKDFLVTHLNGVTTFNNGNPIVAPALAVTIFHNHNGKQLQLSEKAMLAANAYGTGANPYILETPYLIPAGDQITLQVQAFIGTGSELAPNSLAEIAPGYYLSAYFTLIGGVPRGND